MLRRAILLLPILLAGCATQPRRTTPTRNAPREAPRRDGPMPLAERVRQEGWLTRFWEQLTRSQRRRVLARLRASEPPRATDEAEAAQVWDSLGLPERNALIFGLGLPGNEG